MLTELRDLLDAAVAAGERLLAKTLQQEAAGGTETDTAHERHAAHLSAALALARCAADGLRLRAGAASSQLPPESASESPPESSGSVTGSSSATPEWPAM